MVTGPDRGQAGHDGEHSARPADRAGSANSGPARTTPLTRFLSTLTDKIVEGMVRWGNRQLDPIHPVIPVDSIHVEIRDGQVADRPIYVGSATKTSMRWSRSAAAARDRPLRKGLAADSSEKHKISRGRTGSVDAIRRASRHQSEPWRLCATIGGPWYAYTSTSTVRASSSSRAPVALTIHCGRSSITNARTSASVPSLSQTSAIDTLP
jgi:hypothetical protein